MADQERIASVAAGRFEWEGIFRDADVKPPTKKLLGLIMATFADTRSGANVRPGVKRLAAAMGASERNTLRYVAALESEGWISCLRRGSSYGRGGKGMASTYQLTVPVSAFGLPSVPEQVTPMSCDSEQVTPTSPDVDNPQQGPHGDVEQVTPGAGTPDIQRRTPDTQSGTGDTHVALPLHESPLPLTPLQSISSPWTVNSPRAVDNNVIDEEDARKTFEDKRNDSGEALWQWATANLPDDPWVTNPNDTRMEDAR